MTSQLNIRFLSVQSNNDQASHSHSQQPLTGQMLHQQTLAFQGTGGTSTVNRPYGFLPAFLDTETGEVYLARFADGRPAPMHLLEGLPRQLVMERDLSGRSTAIKHSVIAGFVRDGKFYTREQAAQSLTN